MATYKDKKERKMMRDYAVSIAVDNETTIRGTQQLDKNVLNAKAADEYITKQTELKKKLFVLLKQATSTGLTESLQNEINSVKQQLSELNAPQQIQTDIVETQDISGNFNDMKKSNIEFANKYELDLSDPFMAMFSNSEQVVIANELSEKFDLLKLDKFDYAFAAFVGLIGGIIDAVFIGTATKNPSESGKLVQFTDDVYDKVVRKYASLKKKENISDTKMAINYLQDNFKVSYDARYPKDTAFEISGLSPNNHHLKSLSHSPLGLIFGIIDILNGTSTFYSPDGKFKIKKVAGVPVDSKDQAKGIIDAVRKWFGHCMSDVAGSSSSKGRGAGLPTGFESILQSFNFGKIPISEKNFNVEYGTIGEIVEKVYVSGYDLRFESATAIPVIVCEALIRIYWLCKQHFYYGKDLKESIPFGKDRELQRLLLICSLSFSTLDLGHAIATGAIEQDPIAMLGSINYIQLANLGYKLIVNFRLEHEHNEKVKELMQNEIKDKFDELINL